MALEQDETNKIGEKLLASQRGAPNFTQDPLWTSMDKGTAKSYLKEWLLFTNFRKLEEGQIPVEADFMAYLTYTQAFRCPTTISSRFSMLKKVK